MTVQIKHDTAGVATFQAGGSGNVTLTLPTSTGTLATTADTGVTGFTSSQNTSSPNDTVNVSQLLVSAASTNADIAMNPKGTGAVLAHVPDSTATGGNKRGANAVDLQTKRSAASNVASGAQSVLSGGRYNTSSNTYSVVCGGNSNTASGQKSIVCGGSANTASGSSSVVVGGQSQTSSSFGTVVCGGFSNTASNNYSFVGGGQANVAGGKYSSIVGGYNATTRGLYGCSSIASGKFGTVGDAQRGQYILRGLTTDATLKVLTADQGAASTTNQVILPNNSCYGFEGRVTSHRTDVIGAGAIWTFSGGIRRGANAASTVMITVCTPVQISADAEAIGWLLEVTEDTTNGGLKVSFTGEASKTIRTVCVIETTECTS